MTDPLNDPAVQVASSGATGTQPGGPDWVNEPGDVPIVLTYTPVPYVALLGLNATVNELHLSIWNHFTQNRAPDRPPIYFKLHPEKTLFPPQKEKVSTRRSIPSFVRSTHRCGYWILTSANTWSYFYLENILRMAHTKRDTQMQLDVQAPFPNTFCGCIVFRTGLG